MIPIYVYFRSILNPTVILTHFHHREHFQIIHDLFANLKITLISLLFLFIIIYRYFIFLYYFPNTILEESDCFNTFIIFYSIVIYLYVLFYHTVSIKIIYNINTFMNFIDYLFRCEILLSLNYLFPNNLKYLYRTLQISFLQNYSSELI